MNISNLMAAHGVGVGGRKFDFKKEMLVSATRMRRTTHGQTTDTDPVVAVGKTKVAQRRSESFSVVDVYDHRTKQLICSINLSSQFGVGFYPDTTSAIISGAFIGDYLVMSIFNGSTRHQPVYNATTGAYVRNLSAGYGWIDWRIGPDDALYTVENANLRKIDTSGNIVWTTLISTSNGNGAIIAGFEDGFVYIGHSANGIMSYYNMTTGAKQAERMVTSYSTQTIGTMRKFGSEYFVLNSGNEYRVFTDNTLQTPARTVKGVSFFYKISDTEMLVCGYAGTAGYGEMFTVNPANFAVINPCISAFNILEQPIYEEQGKVIYFPAKKTQGDFMAGQSLVKVHLKG
ncbi:hypothetical protein HPY27_24765 [Brevibacillus sp. HB1.1]|uniref:hypothetical protein n=1 Tax=Brevibacillus sp. HB1.1 TaxID=2738808 RepID=UPI0015751F24|nr:hypothetical protein [Brevibacillus sp. HB1.1]NTU33371.1 hypothetical protein [Brevibacillus sp. HB1.1]